MAVNLVRDELDVAALARRILDPRRESPLVLVSIPRNAHTPLPDMRRLQEGVGTLAEIHTVPHEFTVSLSKRLTQRGAFKGGARVYPPGIDENFESRLSMLRLPAAFPTPAQFADILAQDVRSQAEAFSASRVSGPAGGRTPTGSGSTPQTAPGWTVVTDDQTARGLAAHLFDPGRTRPVVVITIASGRDGPYADVAAVHAAVAGLADVYLMGTGSPSLAFSDAMPEGTQVFGGASRVYPVGTGWVDDLSRSPLRFCFHTEDGAAVGEALISDAMRMSRGSVSRTPARTVSGEVSGVVHGRAIVRLAGGGMASIWPELTADTVAADRLFRVGMAVKGTWDASAGRLDVAQSVRAWREGVRHYRPGDLVLGAVLSVESDLCVIGIYPDLPVVVDTADVLRVSPPVDLRQVVSEDEIVVCRVVSCGLEEEDWALSLLDVSPGDPVIPAPSLLPGGPPWLPAPAAFRDRVTSPDDRGRTPPAPAAAPTVSVPPGSVASSGLPAVAPTVPAVPLAPPAPVAPAASAAASPVAPTVPAAASTVATPVPTAASTETTSVPTASTVATPTSASPVATAASTVAPTVPAVPAAPAVGDDERISSLTRERDDFAERLRKGKVRLEAKEDELREVRRLYRDALAEVGQLRERLGSADEAVRTLEADAHLFADPLDQLTFEVNLAWARRFPAGEKSARPLATWTVGSGFLASLASVQGVDRSKVVDVIVEVLTGVVHELSGRDSHQLRQGSGGDDPFVTRQDGATCWRVSLQHKTPSARRLHFWMLNDQTIELSAIRLHDDMRP